MTTFLDPRLDLRKADCMHQPVEFLHTYRNQPEITELLLQKGAGIDALNKGGCSTLHVAVNKQHLKCVKVLLKHKCNVNIQVSSCFSSTYYQFLVCQCGIKPLTPAMLQLTQPSCLCTRWKFSPKYSGTTDHRILNR